MERLQGRVTGLDHEQRIVGRHRDGRQPAAVHFYRFELAGRRLELRHGAPLPLGDGDDVVAVCAGRRSPARVYAWHNRTRGATLVEPRAAGAAMRGWLPAIPAAILLALAGGFAGPDPGLVRLTAIAVTGPAGLALALLALRGFREYGRYRRAAAILEVGERS